MIKLKYSNEDKSLSSGGWILDYNFLKDITSKLDDLNDETLHIGMEEVEAVLLVVNGELELLKERLIELEDF